MFPTAELTASGLPILITDHLEAPAEFLLYRTITEHLKARKQNRCILLSMSNDLPRWKSIFAKSNINLDLQINSGLFKFVDLLTYLQPAKLTTSPLVPLFNLVKEYIGLSAGQESRDLVVFDDTSSLEWLGHSTIDSTRFIRAMCSICSEPNVSLFLRHHIINQEEPDDLLRHLLQVVAYHVEVIPLSSGKSGAVSGEIALHPGSSLVKGSLRTIQRNQAVQYRVTDYGAVYFDKGTGGGVL